MKKSRRTQQPSLELRSTHEMKALPVLISPKVEPSNPLLSAERPK